MSESLSDRVRALLSARYPDGAKRAAARIGIPQPTLHLILSGKTENPRAITLQAIASHFDTTVGWLLTGEGDMPPALGGDRQYHAVERVLARLGLPVSEREGRRVLQAVAQLGEVSSQANRALRLDARTGDGVMRAPISATDAARLQAVQRQLDLWLAALLDAFVVEWGETRAREQLQREKVLTVLGLLCPPDSVERIVKQLDEPSRRARREPAAKKTARRRQ